PIKEFLIFQGPQTAAFSQLARAVCRRAERSTWRLAEAEKDTDPSGVSPEILRWLNRFSDFLFTLGRTFSENVPDENVSAKRNIGSENE
ncbi:MAG: ATP:cob(I)alamin adenosyltransferase, partial [Thermoguttaceae bacterium]|nr:ATP:cob(I)alamin adenosyltransferase [Thermoguttaceae bacterium]